MTIGAALSKSFGVCPQVLNEVYKVPPKIPILPCLGYMNENERLLTINSKEKSKVRVILLIKGSMIKMGEEYRDMRKKQQSQWEFLIANQAKEIKRSRSGNRESMPACHGQTPYRDSLGSSQLNS